MKQYLIFDLDGTLLDSMGLWRDAGLQYLDGKKIPHPEGYFQMIKNQGVAETATFFRTLGLEHFTAQEILDEIIALIAEGYRTNLSLKPYVLDYLKQEKKKGNHLCIATASELSYVMLAMERLQLTPYFEFITSCTEMGCTKSEPDFYLSVMKRIGGTPENTMVFEDALYALLSAKAAGLTTIGVEDETAAEDKEEIQSLCHRYITSFADLLEK